MAWIFFFWVESRPLAVLFCFEVSVFENTMWESKMSCRGIVYI